MAVQVGIHLRPGSTFASHTTEGGDAWIRVLPGDNASDATLFFGSVLTDRRVVQLQQLRDLRDAAQGLLDQLGAGPEYDTADRIALRDLRDAFSTLRQPDPAVPA